MLSYFYIIPHFLTLNLLQRSMGDNHVLISKYDFLLQKTMSRNITISPYSPTTVDLFKRLSVIEIFDLYTYRLAAPFKLELTRRLYSLQTLASLGSKKDTYETHSKETWHIKTPRSNSGLQMFKYGLQNLFNV